MEYLKKAEKSGNRAAEKLIADMLYEDGKIDKAITYYKKVLNHDKNDIEAMRQLGYIYKEREELGKALSYFRRYLKKVTDYNEKKMIENEVYYIQQNMPKNSHSGSEQRVEQQPAGNVDEEDDEEEEKENPKEKKEQEKEEVVEEKAEKEEACR